MGRERTALEKYDAAVQRLARAATVAQQMSRWKKDLESRLWRAQVSAKLGGQLYDIKQLEIEVRAFNDVSAWITRSKEAGQC